MGNKPKCPFTYVDIYRLYHNGKTIFGYSYDDLEGHICFDTKKEKEFLKQYKEAKTDAKDKETELKALFHRTLFDWYDDLQEQCLKFISENKIADDQDESTAMWLLGLIEIAYSVVEELLDYTKNKSETKKLLSLIKNAYVAAFDTYKLDFGLEGFELNNGEIGSNSIELWNTFENLEALLKKYDDIAFDSRSWTEGLFCLQLSGTLIEKLPEDDSKGMICEAITEATDFFIDGPVIIDSIIYNIEQ